MKDMGMHNTIKYGSTLRELFLACDFGKIAEHVRADKELYGHVESFREAYDILIRTETSAEGCCRIDVEWYDLNPSEGEGRFLYASQILCTLPEILLSENLPVGGGAKRLLPTGKMQRGEFSK